MTLSKFDTLIDIIKSIKDTPEYSIQDKLDALDEIKEIVKDVADKQKNELLKTCRYCKHCNQYYINESWKVEKRVDISDEPIWDPDPFAEPRSKMWKIEFDECTCPVGHKIRENIEHLYTIK